MAGRSSRRGRAAIALAAALLIPSNALASSANLPSAQSPRHLAASISAFLAEKRDVAASLAARKQLPDSKILPTQPRQQTTDYNCGPAVAQVIINFTRGISSTALDGADRDSNWTTQSTLGRWMGTTILYGTGAPGVAQALNRSGGLKKPFSAWSYAIDPTGGPRAFHDKVVTDIAVYGMPLAMAINPHMAKVGIHQLASWPDERPLARHWIVVRGYDGRWGSPSPIIHYSDSSAGYGGGTGNYWDLAEVLHETNDRNYGRIVW